jgi:uncharacterized membrane protein
VLPFAICFKTSAANCFVVGSLTTRELEHAVELQEIVNSRIEDFENRENQKSRKSKIAKKQKNANRKNEITQETNSAMEFQQTNSVQGAQRPACSTLASQVLRTNRPIKPCSSMKRMIAQLNRTNVLPMQSISNTRCIMN